MKYRNMSWVWGSLLWPFAIVAVGTVGKGAAQNAQPIVFADMQRQLLLEEKTAIGSIDGEHDTFGRIMSLAIDSRGRLVVADDLSHDLRVFDSPANSLRPSAGPARVRGNSNPPGKFRWALATASMSGIRDALRFRCSVPTTSSVGASWFRRAGP